MAKDKDIKLAQANVSIQNLIDYLVNYSVTDCILEEYCPWVEGGHDLAFAADEETKPKNCWNIDCEYCKRNLYPPVLRKSLLEKYIIHQ